MPRRRRDEPAKLPENIASIVQHEDIYAIINYVQVTRDEVSFIACYDDSVTMEHLLRDSDIPFIRKEIQSGVRYNLGIPPEKEIPTEKIIFDDDEYPDELIEDGQCF